MDVGGSIRRFFEALSRPPGHTWPDGVLHHGARIALLILLAVATYLLFPATAVPDLPALERGMVADRDIIAEVPFTVLKSRDELTQQQDEAAAFVAPIFRYDPGAVDTMRARVASFNRLLESAAESRGTDEERAARMRRMLGSFNLPAGDDALALLSNPRYRDALMSSLVNVADREFAQGIAGRAELQEVRLGGSARIQRDGTDLLVPRDSIRAEQSLWGVARSYLPMDAPSGLAEVQRLVLITLFEPSLRLDRVATTAARQAAREAVPTKKGDVLRGERIITAHEQVSEDGVERLRAYQDHLTRAGLLEPGSSHARHIAGTLIINLGLLAIYGFLLYFYRPAVYGNFRHVLLLAVLWLALAGAARVLGTAGRPELVPIAFPVLTIAILWDGRMALNFSLVAALLLSAQAPFAPLSHRLLLVFGGAAAALSVRVVRRRAQGLILGAVVAGAYVLASVALGLLLSHPLAAVATRAGLGSANGLASALLAMGFLPLLEAVTRITTDQTLLELADLNRPLLKRLSLEAPGTYAHSINVANLAEAAARAVDANPLLVRVGSYYHDVGKIGTPQYFIENQVRGRNPHDGLDPATSAAIIRNHVLEGLRLAEQAKLPDAVRDFIAEHHGTQSIGFFYDKARQSNPDAQLNAADFAYPGPLPQTKEAAIIMLADSVESASKTVQDPTPERIAALVDRIVDGKLSHGQLDESPLTFQDIARIKEQLTKVLSGMYHHRIDYPGGQPSRPPPTVTATGRASP